MAAFTVKRHAILHPVKANVLIPKATRISVVPRAFVMPKTITLQITAAKHVGGWVRVKKGFASVLMKPFIVWVYASTPLRTQCIVALRGIAKGMTPMWITTKG
jgi:hypothetical protein